MFEWNKEGMHDFLVWMGGRMNPLLDRKQDIYNKCQKSEEKVS